MVVKYPIQKEEHTQVRDRLPSVTTDKRLRTESVAVGQEQARSHVLKAQSVSLSVCLCLSTHSDQWFRDNEKLYWWIKGYITEFFTCEFILIFLHRFEDLSQVTLSYFISVRRELRAEWLDNRAKCYSIVESSTLGIRTTRLTNNNSPFGLVTSKAENWPWQSKPMARDKVKMKCPKLKIKKF